MTLFTWFRKFLWCAIFVSQFPLVALGEGTLDIPLYHIGNRKTGWTHGQKGQDRFLDKVQPVLAARCVSCHGCYEGPCQLNLQSYDGVRRGYNAIPIFSSKRVEYTAPTRLEDAKTIERWREMKFLPVVAHASEAARSDKADKFRDALMYRFLQESIENNRENFSTVAAAANQKDWIANSKHACVATKDQLTDHFSASNEYGVVTFADFTSKSRNLGMPFGLPRLSETADKALGGDSQQSAVLSWLEAGAEGPNAQAQALLEQPTNAAPVIAWEAFLNQDSTKAQQTARYIFEHVYSAIIHFDENPGEYFDLVRAKNLAGPIDRIVTELPSQDPGVARVYYRFKKVTRAIVQKTANVWKLNGVKLKHLDDMFMNRDWKVANIPAPQYNTNNIFDYFSSIPADVRSHFMQENSRLIVGAMVQGMVCIGSTATYAIADHFWAWFLKPEIDPSVQNPSLGLPTLSILNTNPEPWVPQNFVERQFLEATKLLDLANQKIATKLIRDYRALINFLGFDSSSQGGDDMLGELVVHLAENKVSVSQILGAIEHFLRTTDANQKYQEAWELELRKLLKAQKRNSLSLNDLWKGDGDPNYPASNSPNAWINVTRHQLNTSVQFGPEGGFPQSIWIMSYSNFERLYYNLVAEYKAWGELTHKMATWRHMSYVRLEGEDLAISLLPIAQRDEVRGWFTRGLGGVKNRLFFPLYSSQDMYSSPPKVWEIFKRHDLPARTEADANLIGGTATESVDKIVDAQTQLLANVAAKALILDDKVSQAQRDWEKGLIALENRNQAEQGESFAQFIPNTTYLRVEGPNKESWVYTILADREYLSHNLMLLENPNRDPQYDTLAVYRGFVGAYPEVFLDIPAASRDRLAGQIEKLRSDKDWLAIVADYGVRRNTQAFLNFFDWIHTVKDKDFPGNDPIEQGIVDLSQHHFSE